MKKLVKGFASVILASMFVFIGCKPTSSTSEPPSGGSDPKITVTVQGDEHVEKVEPATLSVRKGSTWSAIKSKINVTPKPDFVHVGWKETDKNGADLTDDKKFEKDTTVFAVSKEAVTITIKGDAGVDKVEPATLSVAKGSTWSAIKSQIRVTYNDDYGEAGWKKTNASGADLTDDYPFNSDTTVYACSKKLPVITLKGDERIDLSTPLQIKKPSGTKWSSIKAEIGGKINPSATWKDDWENGDYAVYEWRLDGETGEKIGDDRTFTEDTTVYAVSNYKKWKIEDDGSGNKVLSGVEGSKPRGKIILPDSVTSIGSRAFSWCSLTGITIPASVTTIGSWAFNGCSSISSINIPASVTSIEDNAFADCKNLKTLTVDSGNTKYKSVNNIIYTIDGKNLISAAGGLSGTIDIPDDVTSIGSWAFNGCSSLSSITIPASVTSIGSWAFNGCSSLSSINIPASVTSIGSWAFSGCTNLKTLTVDSGNTNYKSVNNIIYTKDGKNLIAVASGLTGTIDIPDDVTSIEDSAFYGCSSLTGITIPASVTTIGSWAFYGCSSLSSITIPASVDTIGFMAFSGCSGLTSVIFASTSNWEVYQDSNYTTKKNDINWYHDLYGGSNAAKLLTDTYKYLYWKKN